MALHYLETGSTEPEFNLAFEEYVLENKREGDWLILWQNESSVIIGLNQNVSEEVDEAYVSSHGIRVVRRMTGGGAVYHDLGNLNYSFITEAGNTAELSMQALARPVCSALRSLGLRAELSGRNDICIDGRKVSGTAQRLSGGRVLHHGTLLFDTDADALASALRPRADKFESKAAKSVRSRTGNIRDFLGGDLDVHGFRRAILAQLAQGGLVCESLGQEELARVGELANAKYRSWDWNRGRSPDFSFRARRRFPAGSIEAQLQLVAGKIEAAAFVGDFLSLRDCSELCEALRGCRFEPAEFAERLRAFPLYEFFGGIGAEELMLIIFGGVENEGSQKA